MMSENQDRTISEMSSVAPFSLGPIGGGAAKQDIGVRDTSAFGGRYN